jgi:hypothetical protein
VIQSAVEEGSKVVSGEERLRVDSGFSYLIREVEQMLEQLSVTRSVREILLAGCQVEKSDV